MRTALSRSRISIGAAAACISAVIIHSACLAAQPAPLSGPDIKSLVSGTKVHLHTPIGTYIPVLYRNDGTLAGRADGMVAFFLGGSRDEGKWWVTRSKLCQQWKIWFKGKKKCLDIRRKGADFHWSDGKGESGLATIVSRPVVAGSSKRTKEQKRIGSPKGLGGPLPNAKKPSISKKHKRSVATVKAPRSPSKKVASVARKNARKAGASKAQKKQKYAAIIKNKGTAQPSAPITRRSAKAAHIPPLPQKNTRRQLATQNYRVVGVAEYDVLNIRRSPTSKAFIIGEIPPYARSIQSMGPCLGDWCPINFEGRIGWVNQTFLKADSPAKGRSYALYQVVRVFADDVLNIRRTPSSEAPIDGAILPNARDVRLTGDCLEEWCPVAQGGQRGWVHRYFIAPLGG